MGSDIYNDWHEDYARKVMSADDAARLIQPGMTLGVPATGVTPTLFAAVMRRANEIDGLKVYVCAPVVDPGWFDPGHPNIEAHVETFNTAASRAGYEARRAPFTSVLLSRRFKAEDERGHGPHHADVAFLSVSQPDRWGFCSFGLGMWNKLTFAKHAQLVLAEVNPDHPRTGGANRIHVSEIDVFVEDLTIPPVMPASIAGAVAPRPLAPGIVGGVAELVQNGDTIQIGTGDRTNLLCVAGTFDGKEDLGYHAELCVAGINDLVRNGVITGRKKTLHPGKFVATQLLATTPDDIAFIHENPMYEVYAVEYTNDPLVIAQHDNMVAINNALAIDFGGQISAESIDGKLWSGPGGQPEFAVGAFLARGGKNITIIEATARQGTISRIMPVLPAGTVITVPKTFADYVVTEFGIASLLGKSDRERAEELISVAHPDHRAELRREAQRMFYP